MYMKYGKVVFGEKDTFGLNYTLRPIIYAGLIKFKETLEKRDKEGKVYGVPLFEVDQDIDEASKKWFETIEKMCYAFNENSEPDIVKYNIGFDFLMDEGIGTISVKDQEAYNQYTKDIEIHEQKVKEGLELFAKYYDALWW